ncbi:MAG: pyridine nucleotide-disulfide oxidoreductase, partial [Betaproteobacteria bacterium]
MTKGKWLLIGLIAALVAAYFVFDLGQYFSLGYLKSQQAAIDAYYASNPLQTVAVFFLIYVAVTGLSLPGATIMTLAAGAVFGLLWGTLIVSFASSCGATLAFLASRFVLKSSVQAKFGDKLKAI